MDERKIRADGLVETAPQILIDDICRTGINSQGDTWGRLDPKNGCAVCDGLVIVRYDYSFSLVDRLPLGYDGVYSCTIEIGDELCQNRFCDNDACPRICVIISIIEGRYRVVRLKDTPGARCGNVCSISF